MNDGLASGSTFAGHLIDEEIGRGGMGVVYRARHLALDRIRALKVLAPELSADEDYVKRFRRESRLAASVEHPNLVTVHHAGEESGRLFMSMQFIDGVDLGRLLADGPPSRERALRILADVAGALDAAHSQGLIHRDVKPENILLEGELDEERAFLTDFGIGTLAEASDRKATKLTTRGVVLGSTDYIAPEQIRGEDLDGRADVYSLGCVAFHMLTGAPPFAGETQLAVLAAHGSAPRPLASPVAPGVPASADAELAAAMAIDPADRPASASAFIDRLSTAVASPAAAGVPTVPLPERPSHRDGRGAWGLILLAAAVVAVVAAGIVLLAGGSDDDGGTAAHPAAVATSFPVPRGPVSVAAGADLVWVASRNADRITAFARDGSQPGDIPSRGFDVEDPRELALGFGYLWATGRDGLFRIDLGGGDIDKVLELDDPSDVTVDADHVWVLDRAPQPEVMRFDPETHEGGWKRIRRPRPASRRGRRRRDLGREHGGRHGLRGRPGDGPDGRQADPRRRPADRHRGPGRGGVGDRQLRRSAGPDRSFAAERHTDRRTGRGDRAEAAGRRGRLRVRLGQRRGERRAPAVHGVDGALPPRHVAGGSRSRRRRRRRRLGLDRRRGRRHGHPGRPLDAIAGPG